MTDETKTERKKIKIKTINAPRTIREGLEVTEFMGEDNVKYEVWSKTLVAELKEGGEIDADIVYSIKETEQGTFYHNKIAQIYVDGQPVRGKQGSYGGKGYHSPEERASIEAQVAFKGVIELRISGDIDDKNPLYQKALKWCNAKLDSVSGVAVSRPDSKAEPKAKPETSQALADKKSDMFAFIAEKKKFRSTRTTKDWLVNVLKIKAERIDSDPEGVLKEVAELEGWKL